jgi:predicted Zn finger-like uncharacterized protein
MHIACPACNAAYEVPDRLIGSAGRRLRCARCGHDWLVLPAEDGATEQPAPAAGLVTEAEAGGVPPPTLRIPPPREPPASPPLPPEPHRDLPPHPVLRRPPQIIDPPLPQLGDTAPPRMTGGLWAAWIASVLVVVCFVAALVAFRVEIATAWPPAARLYLALGLDIGR